MEGDHQDISRSTNLAGLGGWLILVGIGIFLMPIRLAFFLITTYMPMFTDGTWTALTDPTSENFASFWKPLLSLEICVNMGLMIAGIYLIVLFFEKKKRFPPWFIGILVVGLLWVVTDAVVVSILVPGESVFDGTTLKEVLRSVIGCAIWVPYMLVSKRVKATFVN